MRLIYYVTAVVEAGENVLFTILVSCFSHRSVCIHTDEFILWFGLCVFS